MPDTGPQMASLRTLLILLLCLAIPMASWASVADVSFCPATAKAVVGATAHSHRHVHAHVATAHGHDQAVGKLAGHRHAGAADDCTGKTCQHDCRCGCGMGACTSGFATLFGGQAAVALFAPGVAIAPPVAARHFVARGSSPLRPPIS